MQILNKEKIAIMYYKIDFVIHSRLGIIEFKIHIFKMKNTETKWTNLVSVRIDKEIMKFLKGGNCEDLLIYKTLSEKINHILREYVIEKEKNNT